MEILAPKQEEIQAVSIIQRAYRRWLSRRRAVSKQGLSSLRSHFFTLCLKESHEIVWTKSTYKRIFLGPLPHVLLCLNIAHENAQLEKTRIKKGLRDADHEHLEELGKRLTTFCSILKEIIQLQKVLGPKAKVHYRQDLVQLRKDTMEACALLRRLPFSAPEDLTADLALGFKGIVAQKSLGNVKMKQKPTLNVDDVYF